MKPEPTKVDCNFYENVDQLSLPSHAGLLDKTANARTNSVTELDLFYSNPLVTHSWRSLY